MSRLVSQFVFSYVHIIQLFITIISLRHMPHTRSGTIYSPYSRLPIPTPHTTMARPDPDPQTLAAHARTPTFLTIKSFHGLPMENASEWMILYNIQCNHVGWTTQQRCDGLVMYLEHSAKSWYFALDDATRNDFTLLKAAFLKRFGPEAPTKVLRESQLRNRRQLKGESVENFSNEIRGLCSLLNKSPSETLNCFMAGLLPDIQIQVFRQQPTDFESALRLAMMEESFIHMRPSEPPAVQAVHPDALSSKVDALSHQFESLMKVLSAQKDAPPQSNAQRDATSKPVCGYCGKTGHNEFSCFQKQKNARPKLICSFCGKNNHAAKNCFARLRSAPQPTQYPPHMRNDYRPGNYHQPAGPPTYGMPPVQAMYPMPYGYPAVPPSAPQDMHPTLPSHFGPNQKN